MKLEVTFGGQRVLFTPEQLDEVLRIVDKTESVEEKYVGKELGDNGSNYLMLLQPTRIMEIKINAHTDDYVDARRLVTKLHNEKESS